MNRTSQSLFSVLIKLTLLLGICMAAIAHGQFAAAQPNQTSYTVNLTYLSVQLSYPSTVLPGDSVSVNLQANAKSSINAVSLTAQVYYADGASLHQLASATINSNYMQNAGSLSKQIQFTIPTDAPRTSLFAALTESVQQTHTSYYYYPVYYNYSSPYCDYAYYYGYYCDYTYYGTYPYSNYGAYPSYSYSTTTDSGTAPLSYIKAVTPEYVSLQSEYQMVQQQLTQSQQQLSQSQSENQQLKQNLQDAQNSISQKDATISSLNQQSTSIQNMNSTLKSGAAVLAIIVLLLAILLAHERGKNRGMAQASTPSRS